MKRLFFILVLLAVFFTFVTGPVLAGGDKVRGDEADGPAYQLGDCPFYG